MGLEMFYHRVLEQNKWQIEQMIVYKFFKLIFQTKFLKI